MASFTQTLYAQTQASSTVLRLHETTSAAAHPDVAQDDKSLILNSLRVKIGEEKGSFRISWLKWVIALLECPYLTEDEKEFVEAWQGEFDEEFPFFNGHVAEDDAYSVSIALCMVLCNAIFPGLDRSQADSREESALLDLEMSARSLLESTIPVNETVDSFIESYEIFAQKRALMQETLARVDQLFEAKIAEIYQTANCNSEELRECYEKLKSKLHQLNLERQTRMDHLHEQLEEPTLFLQKYSKIVENLTSQMENLDQRMAATRQTIYVLLENCKMTIRKVR